MYSVSEMRNKKRKLDLNFVPQIKFLPKNYYYLNNLNDLTVKDLKSHFFPRSEMFYSHVKNRAGLNSENFSFLYDLTFKRKIENEDSECIEEFLSNGQYYTPLDSLMCSIRSLYKNPVNSNLDFDFYRDVLKSFSFNNHKLGKYLNDSFLENILSILVGGVGIQTLFKLESLYNVDFNFGSFDLPETLIFVDSEISFFYLIYNTLYSNDQYVYKLYNSISHEFNFDFSRWKDFVVEDRIFSERNKGLISNTFNLGEFDSNIFSNTYSKEEIKNLTLVAHSKIEKILELLALYNYSDVKTNVICLAVLRSAVLELNYKEIDYDSSEFVIYTLCLRLIFLCGYDHILNKNIFKRARQIYKINLNSKIYLKDLLKKHDIKSAITLVMSGDTCLLLNEGLMKDHFIQEFANQDREEFIALTLPMFLEIHILELFWNKSK